MSGDSATPSPRTNTHPFLGPCHEATLQVPDLPLPPSSDLNPGQIWSSWGSSQSRSFGLNNDFSKCQHTQSGGRETGHDKTHIFKGTKGHHPLVAGPEHMPWDLWPESGMQASVRPVVGLMGLMYVSRETGIFATD